MNMEEPVADAPLVKRAMRAMEAVERKMDAARSLLPAHKREKYFGGYREKLLEAKVRAVMKVLKATPNAALRADRPHSYHSRVLDGACTDCGRPKSAHDNWHSSSAAKRSGSTP